MPSHIRITLILVLLALFRGSFANELGPKDGHDLPPVDFDRVALSTNAPDFALETSTGSAFDLREAAGKSNVLLVFYRGVW